MSRSAFSGGVNTQNHTWISGLPSLVINIVFFVAFFWMCVYLRHSAWLFTYFGCPSMSPQVRLVYLILVQNHANVHFFAEQATARVDVQFLTVAGVARFANLAYLARHTLFSLVLPRNVAGCLHLRRPRRTETTVCRAIYMVLLPVPHSHSKRHEASSRARRRSWRHATRKGSHLPSRRSRSRLLKWLWRCCRDGCRNAPWNRSWVCQCCGSWKKSWRLLLVSSSATFEQATAQVNVQAACGSRQPCFFCGEFLVQAMESGTCCSRRFSHIKTGRPCGFFFSRVCPLSWLRLV